MRHSDHHLHKLVTKHMIHGPCGYLNPSNSCMQKEGKCKFKYPKQLTEQTTKGKNSYPLYKRPKMITPIKVRGHNIDNSWIVPYNPFLLKKFGCHINVEICSDIKVIKYIYKYICKGHDKIAFFLHNNDTNVEIDEIKEYQSARWVSPPEAAWRLFSFPISEMIPSVCQLQLHLDGQQVSPTLCMVIILQNVVTSKTTLYYWAYCHMSSTEGERYYLRLLLMNIRAPKSSEDLRLIDGKCYATFREVAEKNGLLYSDNNLIECMSEAVTYQMPYSLRRLFATLLVYCNPGEFKDIFGNVSFCKTTNEAKEIYFERNIIVSEKDIHLQTKLNVEQKRAYDIILERVYSNKSGAFFIDGPGGTGKTFVYRALLAAIRTKGYIALANASSGVAASILPGGRTAHSRFKIPIDIDENFTCNISKQSSLATLIKDSKLIVWDEVSMAKKNTIEALDTLLKDLMNTKTLFGGKVVVFGGDFRQTLLLLSNGKKEDFIGQSLLYSHIWNHLEKLCLSENMRAKNDPAFCAYLMRIGNGQEKTNNYNKIEIPNNFVIPFTDEVESLNLLFNITYPDFPIDETIEPNDQCQFEDFLHTLHPANLPPYRLTLKKYCPVILLRNLNPIEGLCNGTRLICHDFKSHVISAIISSGDFKNKHVFIPKIPLLASQDEKLPVPFKRTQFPIRLCFAMTINKAQGQTLDFVGIYLREPVFSHGQLYVALSRAKCSDNVKILIRPSTAEDTNDHSTYNVVYDEIIRKAFL
ncbi:hypothetical protein H5410_008112 [Solanum commersonii]|uniref:ATP-dependent DNA helicase n=1 Tax=Solanum commersonii TaxID=4109 RepID=A0A9J6ADZ9_SOLCO|nr:hypothetical protein H5410_008112 [Solanum commersonii]